MPEHHAVLSDVAMLQRDRVGLVQADDGLLKAGGEVISRRDEPIVKRLFAFVADLQPCPG